MNSPSNPCVWPAPTPTDPQDWWNNDKLQGPVIEQGTHVCDLSRYFGGDVNVDTVTWVQS